MDEPRSTQPLLYKEIDNHPSAANVFAKVLEDKGTLNAEAFTKIKKDVENHLRSIYNSMNENETVDAEADSMPAALTNGLGQFDTAVELDRLKALNKGMLKRPDGFKGFNKVERILKRRADALEEGNKADWGTGEALAYASSRELVCSDWVPPKTAASACIVTLIALLSGCCAVRVQPAV